jgi:hypothetical protein
MIKRQITVARQKEKIERLETKLVHQKTKMAGIPEKQFSTFEKSENLFDIKLKERHTISIDDSQKSFHSGSDRAKGKFKIIDEHNYMAKFL